MLLQTEAIDLSTNQVTQGQLALAALLIVFGVAIVALLSYRLKFTGLTEEQVRQKRALIGQREEKTPGSIRIPSSANVRELRADIRALFDENGASDAGSDRVTVRQALRSVANEVRTAMLSRTEGIPQLAVRVAEVALALLITGGLTVVSVQTFREVFILRGDLSLADAFELAANTAGDFINTGIEALGLFPGADFIWALALTISIRVAQWAYSNPLPIAAVLFVFAAAVTVLAYRDVADVEGVRIYESRRSLLWATATRLFVIWAAGAIPAAIVSIVAPADIAGLIGLAFAMAPIIIFAEHSIAVLRFRMAVITDEIGASSPATLVALLVRRAALGLAALASPLIPIYVAVLITQGKLAAVLTAFAQGSVEVQLLAVLLVGLAVAAVAVTAREAWPELKAGLSETTSRQAVRTALWTRAAPTVVFVFAYFVGVGFTKNAVGGIAAGLLGAIVAYALATLAKRARYRASLIESEPSRASRVIIQAWTLTTADGEPRYFATVNTEELAHDDREELVDTIIAVAEQQFAGDEVHKRVEHEFARDMTRFGIVDIAETREKLRGFVEDECRGVITKHGLAVDEDVVEERLDRYPEAIWNSVVTQRVGRGELRIRNGEYVFSPDF